MDADDEPGIELLDGTVVLRAVYDLVTTLRASGHTITIVDHEVQVTPTVPEGAWWVLASNHQDTQAVLDALNDDTNAPPDLRTRTTRETVH